LNCAGGNRWIGSRTGHTFTTSAGRTTQEEELARLYHISIPKQTDLPISYNIAPSQKVLTIPLQSGNGTAIARRPAVGINSLLGERLKDRLPDHKRPELRPSIKRPRSGRHSANDDA
jgi:hypothetical protein